MGIAIDDTSSSITVRDIDPGDKSWLKREARDVGVSMEEFDGACL